MPDLTYPAPEITRFRVAWALSNHYAPRLFIGPLPLRVPSLWLVLRGEANVEGAGQTTTVGAGQWLWFPACASRRVAIGARGMSWLSVGIAARSGVGPSHGAFLGPSKPRVFCPQSAESARGEMFLRELIAANEAKNRWECHGLAQALTGWLWRVVPETGALNCPNWLRAALERVEAEPQVSVATLSENAHFSAAQFRRLWQKHLGQSPQQTLLAHRLERAQAALETCAESLDLIADHAGFSSAQALSRAFKAEFGLAPLAWKRPGEQGSRERMEGQAQMSDFAANWRDCGFNCGSKRRKIGGMSIFPSLSMGERADFERDGFLVWRGVLTPAQVEKWKIVLKDLADRRRLQQGKKPADSIEIRNAIAHEPAILELLDHPRVMGAMRDVLGANIQLSTSHVFERLPTPAATQEFKAIGWHADGPMPRPPVIQTPAGAVEPRLYAKAGWFLTDLSQPNRGNLRVVPGSHRLAACAPRDENGEPEGAIQVLTHPGDVVLFENRLWHSVGPNYASEARLNLYMGYCHRWMKPIDFTSMPPELLDAATPLQKQLLGVATEPLSFYLPSKFERDCPLATL